MNISEVGKKIRKWDEVTGNAVEIQIPETVDLAEDVGMGPSISRNHMRGIEDMVEQNDNCFDGIINNVAMPQTPDSGSPAEQQTEAEIAEETKKSVLGKIKEQQDRETFTQPQPKKAVPLCPDRELM
jgi:hypothetical protein